MEAACDPFFPARVEMARTQGHRGRQSPLKRVAGSPLRPGRTRRVARRGRPGAGFARHQTGKRGMIMSLTVQQMLAEANAAVPRIEAAAAQALIAQRGALLLGTRDAPELEKMARAEGARHIPSGMLEFRADPASPFHDPALCNDCPVVLHCASGGARGAGGQAAPGHGPCRGLEPRGPQGLEGWRRPGGGTGGSGDVRRRSTLSGLPTDAAAPLLDMGRGGSRRPPFGVVLARRATAPDMQSWWGVMDRRTEES